MKLNAIMLLASAAMFTGCSAVQERVREGAIRGTLDQRPDRAGFVEAIGIGASDSSLPTDTQRKALARDAAIVKAQYELLAMVKGVQLEGGISVDRAIESDSSLETKLRDTIRGAEVLKSEFTADNGCVVTLRLPKSSLQQMMGVKFR